MADLRWRGAWALLLVGALAAPAAAQSEPPVRHDSGPQAVGVRAAGMGGAFTAVADDASAAFWNPAGFASGSFFSLILDANVLDRRRGTLLALGTPPLGIAYYRTALDAESNGRNTLVAHHAGVSLVQSVGGRLAVGTTLKLVHGVVSTPGGAGMSTNKLDADLGVMATGSLGQLGLTVRNLFQPEFKGSGGAVRLDRRVRAGISIHARQDLVVAADVDLTKGKTFRGDWRDVAVGLEAHPVAKAWLRAGVHWNAAGGSAGGAGTAPIGTVGGSYAVYGAVMLDAQASVGSAAGERGWGLGMRFVF
jgi:hypothetical protein